MITDPGGITTAAARAEQQPLYKATVDWAGDGTDVEDISAQVGSLRITRQITGDLPAEVRTVEGSAVAEATIELGAGDVAPRYSRFNTAGALAGKERLNRPVEIELGLQTAAGPQRVRRFRGLTHSVPVSSTDRSVTIRAFDNRQRFRTPVDIPALAADVGAGSIVKPGLNAQWLVDLVMRRNGFYASPHRTDTVLLSATMHGSAQPETGQLVWAGWLDVQLIVYDVCRFTAGQYGYALAGPTVIGGVPEFYNIAGYTLTEPVGLPQTEWDYLLVEWRGSIDPAVDTAPIKTLFTLGGFTGQLVDVAGVRSLQFLYNRGSSGGPTVTTPLTATQYFAFSVQNRGAAGRRIRITQDAATLAWDVADAADAVDADLYTTCSVEAMGPVEAFTVATGNTGGDTAPPLTWTHTPTAELGPSVNELIAALPSPARDSWGLLQELAQAELAWCAFDEETGTPFYRVQEWWTRTAQQTTSHTITADRDLLALGYDDGISSVRNQISVPVTSLTVTARRDVWTAGDEIKYINGNSRRTFFVDFDDPLIELDRTVQAVIGGVPGTGYSRVSANGQSDGTGFDRSDRIRVSVGFWTATTARITVTNTYPGRLWLVTPTGEPGLHLAGRQIIVNERASAGAYAEDTTSVAEFGAQPLTLPDTPWRQDLGVADGVAYGLLGRLAQPVPAFTGVRVLGNPLRKLGDRARLVDPTGLVVDTEVWITGCDDVMDLSGGYVQDLNVRQAWGVAVWGTSEWGDGSVWGA